MQRGKNTDFTCIHGRGEPKRGKWHSRHLPEGTDVVSAV